MNCIFQKPEEKKKTLLQIVTLKLDSVGKGFVLGVG